ncbi:hypothetical protein CISIN_1g0059942mg, partial [Citrus sinensis]
MNEVASDDIKLIIISLITPTVRMEITYASPSSQNLSSSSQRSSSNVSMPAARPVKVIPLQHPETTSSSSAASSFGASVSKRIGNFKRMTWIQWIETFLPCSRWIRTYKWREYFQVDLMAGTTVGIMLVPQLLSWQPNKFSTCSTFSTLSFCHGVWWIKYYSI